MNLEETWENCLAMWEWIAGEDIKGEDENEVDDLKCLWLDENGFDKSLIDSQCFFCDFASMEKDKKSSLSSLSCCSHCPGKLVDPTFQCINGDYDYEYYPKLFYQKLLELNERRKMTTEITKTDESSVNFKDLWRFGV